MLNLNLIKSFNFVPAPILLSLILMCISAQCIFTTYDMSSGEEAVTSKEKDQGSISRGKKRALLPRMGRLYNRNMAELAGNDDNLFVLCEKQRTKEFLCIV